MTFEKEYENALIRWKLEQKSYLVIGPEPDPANYGFKTDQERWLAAKIRDKVLERK